MVMYSCPRCGYTNKIKTHMRKHFLRQTICSAISSDKKIEVCYQEVLGEKYPSVTQCNPSVTQMSPLSVTQCNPSVTQCNPSVTQCNPNNSDITQTDLDNSSNPPILNIKKTGTSPNISCITKNNPVITNESSMHYCLYCNKEFKRRQHKWRHEQTCKDKDTYTKEEMEDVIAEKMADKDLLIRELKSQIELLLKERGNTTNYNTQNNYIVINAFGNENLKYINKTDIRKMISNSPISSIPNLLKQIHFNPEHEENHNVKIPNKKQARAKIYNGQKWVFQKKERTIQDMTNKAYKTIVNNYDENKNIKWKKILTNIQDDDKNTIERIHDDTEIMILNNQDMVKDA